MKKILEDERVNDILEWMKVQGFLEISFLDLPDATTTATPELSPELWRWKDRQGSTLLHYAAGQGAGKICKQLVNIACSESKQAALELLHASTPKNGRTALHWAARNGQTAVCECLIQEMIYLSQVEADMDVKNIVDVQAKGHVTPLQLAMWQGHLETCQVLCQWGADPHFVNGWGCGVAHWLGKCPNFQNKEHMRSCCEWLFETCQVPWNEPNNHGQRPLHKAAFEGNLPLIQYLVFQKGLLDEYRDHQGNTAADCAERNSKLVVAEWMRRHASPIRLQALKTMEFMVDNDDERDSSPPKEIHQISIPSVYVLRSRYHRLAKVWHPDRWNTTSSVDDVESRHWNRIQEAYQLLLDWWEHPQIYDVKIRLETRNAALHDYPAILWSVKWHEANSHSTTQVIDKCNTENDNNDYQQRLEEFERRLVSLLLTDVHRGNGLSLAQLPKEYKKNWHATKMIRPKDYKCRKWIDLLESRLSHSIDVRLDPEGVQQPRIFAKIMSSATNSSQ